MLKRVLAWVLLAGFVLLILNILVFQYLLAPTITVYVVIVIWFIFTNKPLPSNKKKKAAKNDCENDIEEKTEE